MHMYAKNAWQNYSSEDRKALEAFAADYRKFLDGGKTERECVKEAVADAEKHGFKSLDDVIRNKEAVKPGDRIYCAWMKKSFMAFIIGTEPLENGMNILGAHIDSPRMDIKQNPMYEDESIAYMDTHYYGGIKKYQWVALPLAMHGVVVRKDGSVLEVAIGEDADDPVFYISDLLIHLSAEQMKKTASEVIEGEALNVIIGSVPLKDEEKEPVKKAVLNLLKEKYAIEEEDFLSAELEIVPAGKSREVGFDRSLIAGYGHDDRVCAYPSLRAIEDYEGVPARTLCAILTDKEEIGSVGATGMNSHFFENVIAELLHAAGVDSDLAVRRMLRNSFMLSSDVSAGYDPNFASVFEKKNAAFLGKGICFNKFTGSRGKSGSNDANAEYVAQVRRIMDDNGVDFQTAELGRVDAGGGGTIAYMCAKYGMNVIDAGIAVLSMHAPWELISKADLWEGYKCYLAFLKDAGR